MKHLIKSIILSALFLFPFSVKAQQQKIETYGFDRIHTQIVFVSDHLGFTKAYGKFIDFDGQLILDRKDLSKSSLDLTIKTGSLDLNDKTWNDHAIGDNFFKANVFPEATFKSTKIIRKDDRSATLEGNLTLLGVTKPVMLDVTLNKEGFNKYNGKHTLGFTAHGVLKRSDWGMAYALPDVGDHIELLIQAALERKDQEKVNP